MVRRLLWWLCLLVPVVAFARPSLEAIPDRTEVAAGYPVHLRVLAVDAPVPLHTLDLAPLEGNFIIHKVTDNGSSTILQQGREVEAGEMLITLYPRRSGRLAIPSLSLGMLRSPALRLEVQAAVPGKGPIWLRAGIGESHPWIRQESYVYVDVYDDGRVTGVDAEPLRAAGFFVRPLEPTRRREQAGGRSVQVRRLAWAVMPLYPGKRSLELPMIRVSIGKGLLFPLPPLQVEARPLPSYVPTYLPVGRLAVTSEPLPGELWRDRPHNWRLHIRGRGLSQQGLKRLLEANLTAPQGLRLYPPEYAAAPAGGEDPLEQAFDVTIPFVPLRSGPLRLPELRIPYVDPGTGRLEADVLPAPALRILSPTLAMAKRLGAAAVALLVLIWAARRALGRLARYRLRRRCLRAVRRSDSPAELREALLGWLGAGRPEGPATLQRWDGPPGITDRLQRACFGPKNGDVAFAPLREEVLRALKKAG